MKRAMAGSASGDPPKRRCILTVEAASSSTDRPRVVHTLALNVALDGELTLIIRARMEPEPEEVPTVAVASPIIDADGGTTASATNTAGAPQGDVCSMLVEATSPPTIFALMDFSDYEAV